MDAYTQHTQGSPPWLFVFLEEEYRRQLRTEAKTLEQANKPEDAAAAQAMADAPIDHVRWMKWSLAYLQQQNISSTFFDTAGLGVVLGLGRRVILIPSANSQQGSINNHGAVSITNADQNHNIPTHGQVNIFGT